MDNILNLARSIIKGAAKSGKDFATGYMSTPDQYQDMLKKGQMAVIGNVMSNAPGIGVADDVLKGGKAATELPAEFLELLKRRTDILKQIETLKGAGIGANTIKNLDKQYYNVLKELQKIKVK